MPLGELIITGKYLHNERTTSTLSSQGAYNVGLRIIGVLGLVQFYIPTGLLMITLTINTYMHQLYHVWCYLVSRTGQSQKNMLWWRWLGIVVL